MDSISPEEFRRLQMQVDILQRFLTKTFGSSFLDFCKEAQLALSKGIKVPPPLSNNKSTPSTSNSQQVNGIGSKAEISNGSKSNNVNPGVSATPKSAARRPPPPLLQRPTASRVTIMAGNTEISRIEDKDENGEQMYYYEDGYEEEEDVEILQPETVFSDDETNGTTKAKVFHREPPSRSNSNRNGVKRGHAVAFDYDTSGVMDDTNVNLPAGTDCIVIESEDEATNGENFEYQQEDSYDANNDDDIYEEGLSYNAEDMMEYAGNAVQTETVQTDGNVTFGTVVTAPDTGIQYFQCSFCPSPKVFKHKQSLKEHYLLNHSPTPPAFQCQCGRRFLKQSQLKRHEVVHTAERPFVCPICFKDFTRKDNMTVHMVRNHAEKKHPCPHCPDKIYATLAEVNRHLRLYHSQWKQ
ncbi:unnamed protein product [Orchesella dallaii]|uniref:C2H2-type domain-containing protein n=1 Tax=Orchesella dallaii TaxID=48710 RepID=A0ABP1R7Y9_9HEXA